MAHNISVDISRPDDDPPPQPERRHPNTCPVCQLALPGRRAARAAAGVRAVRLPLPRRRARADRAAGRGGDVRRDDADLRSADPLAFVDLKAYTDRLAAAELETGLGDAMVIGTASIARPADGARDHGLRLHGRLDGLRGGREVRPRLRPRHRPRRAAGVRRGVGRRAHAGEHPRADADGEDGRRRRRAARGRRALRLRPRPPDHGRRDRVVRGARRRRRWRSPAR